MPVSPLAKLLGLHTFVCCHVLPCQAATNMAHLRRCLLACLPPLFREAKMQREQQQRRLQWQQEQHRRQAEDEEWRREQQRRSAAAAEQERQRIAAEEQRQRRLAEQERQRRLAEEERQRMAAAIEQERQRQAAAAAAVEEKRRQQASSRELLWEVRSRTCQVCGAAYFHGWVSLRGKAWQLLLLQTASPSWRRCAGGGRPAPHACGTVCHALAVRLAWPSTLAECLSPRRTFETRCKRAVLVWCA